MVPAAEAAPGADVARSLRLRVRGDVAVHLDAWVNRRLADLRHAIRRAKTDDARGEWQREKDALLEAIGADESTAAFVAAYRRFLERIAPGDHAAQSQTRRAAQAMLEKVTAAHDEAVRGLWRFVPRAAWAPLRRAERRADAAADWWGRTADQVRGQVDVSPWM
jgi:hypothetical protein